MEAIAAVNAKSRIGANMAFSESSKHVSIAVGAEGRVPTMLITRVANRAHEAIYQWRNSGQWRPGYEPCSDRWSSETEIEELSVRGDLLPETAEVIGGR